MTQFSNITVTGLQGAAQEDDDFDTYIFNICRVNI